MASSFKYRAVSDEGSMVRGDLVAESSTGALRKLQDDGLRVIELSGSTEFSAKTQQRPLSLQHQIKLFEDLAIMLDAGMHVDTAILSAKESADSRDAHKFLESISKELVTGTSLSTAFEGSNAFTSEVSAIIASGEATNKLGAVFSALAKEYKARLELRKRIVESLSYPVFLLVLAAFAIGIISTVLVPALLPIFETTEGDIPLVIKLMNLIRLVIIEYGWVVICCLILFLVGLLLPETRGRITALGRNIVERMPYAGRIRKQLILARYLRNLANLTSSNIKLTNALELAGNSVPSMRIKSGLASVIPDVSQGIRLPQALRNTQLFDEHVVSIVEIGDGVNKLDVSCMRASGVLQAKVDRDINRAMAALNPLITIGLGLLVGLLVVSVMTTLLSVNELIIQ